MRKGTCEWCGVEFSAEETKSNNRKLPKCCSRSCYMKNRAKKREEKYGTDVCKSCLRAPRLPGEKRCLECKVSTKRASRKYRDRVAYRRAVCAQCGEDKRLGLFPSRRNKGEFLPSSICLQCREDNLKNGKKHCGVCDTYRDVAFFFGGVRKKSKRSTCVFCLRGLRYGITGQEVLDLLEKQNNTCPVCLADLDINGSPGLVHVDHCHTVGSVRGIVCFSCNMMLGHSRDSPDNLERAASYLRNPPAMIHLGKRIVPTKDEPSNWEAEVWT